MISKLSYDACIILISKPDKDTTKNKNHSPISLMNTGAIIHNKNISKLNSTIVHENDHQLDQAGFNPWIRGQFIIHKSVIMIHHINKQRIKIM